MTKQIFRFVALASVAVVSIFLADIACAAWPAKVFAPYMFLGAGDKFKLTDCDDACGQKFYTLAFIIAQQEGAAPRPNSSRCPRGTATRR